jgi:hypothetical protein
MNMDAFSQMTKGMVKAGSSSFLYPLAEANGNEFYLAA